MLLGIARFVKREESREGRLRFVPQPIDCYLIMAALG